MSNPSIQPRPPRVPFVRPVQVAELDGARAQWLLASNLSEGGVFVRSSSPPRAGTRLRLDLEARGQTLRFAEAEVIWSRPVDLTRLDQGLPGFGARFLPLNEESAALVKHLVDVGGTGSGQAKTLPFTSPAALAGAPRQALHAPVPAIFQRLTPTEKAVTADWPATPPALARTEPKVVVNLDAPCDLELDRRAPRALPARPVRRPAASATSWAGAAALAAAVVAGGFIGWRGLRQAANTPPPAAAARSAAPSDSPEGPGEATAAQPGAKPPGAARPAAAATPVAAAKPVVAHEAKPSASRASKRTRKLVVPAQFVLPSGAVRSVAVRERGGRLQVRPRLVSGAHVARAFALSGPSRLVIDVSGEAPRHAARLPGTGKVADLRIGLRPHGTRLVFDLTAAPGHVTLKGTVVEVALH